MQFSDTTNRTGIVELLEDLTGTQSSTTSSYPIATKTRDINNAFATYMQLAISSSGRWQVDDTNQSDYPIITTTLTSGQQSYSFVFDGSSSSSPANPDNQILDIHRVEVLDSAGNAYLLKPLDQQDIQNQAMTEFMDGGGIPTHYDKTSNGIFLYPSPNYTKVAGLKIYYSRTPVYFLSSDTTKKPGIPDLFHEYLAFRPAYHYCLRHSKPEAKNYAIEVQNLEGRIKEYYRDRNKDDRLQVRTVYSDPR